MDKRERNRLWEREQSENLTDRYVKKAILNTAFSKNIDLKAEDITPEMIELKREAIKLHRELRKAKKLLKNEG